MRYAGVLGAVALTELMAHFLSLGWGLMTLLAAFAWIALSGASTAAKARSTEDRVNALIPAVGTAQSTATAAQSTASSAASAASSAQSTANSAQSTANAAQSALGGYLPLSGGTLSGALTVSGDLKTYSDLIAVGNLYAPGQHQVSVPQAHPTGMQSAPASYSQSWANSVVTQVVNIGIKLGDAGIFN